MDNKYSMMIGRLAERYITAYLKEAKDKIVSIEDIMRTYQGYAYAKTVPDAQMIGRIKARFPDIRIDLERGIIMGIDWITIKAPEKKKQIEFGIKLMQYRLEDMLRLNPLYAEKGFTADNFAKFTKSSIVSGGVIMQHRPIAIGEAIDFLDGEFSECQKGDNGKYVYKGQIHTL
jgi:hypothetical protein